jgi:hypothetical protein
MFEDPVVQTVVIDISQRIDLLTIILREEIERPIPDGADHPPVDRQLDRIVEGGAGRALLCA